MTAWAVHPDNVTKISAVETAISFFLSPKNVAGEISYFYSFICFFIYIQSTDKNEIEFIKQAANNVLIAQEMLHSLALQHVLSMEYGFLYNTNKK